MGKYIHVIKKHYIISDSEANTCL